MRYVLLRIKIYFMLLSCTSQVYQFCAPYKADRCCSLQSKSCAAAASSMHASPHDSSTAYVCLQVNRCLKLLQQLQLSELLRDLYHLSSHDVVHMPSSASVVMFGRYVRTHSSLLVFPSTLLPFRVAHQLLTMLLSAASVHLCMHLYSACPQDLCCSVAVHNAVTHHQGHNQACPALRHSQNQPIHLTYIPGSSTASFTELTGITAIFKPAYLVEASKPTQQLQLSCMLQCKQATHAIAASWHLCPAASLGSLPPDHMCCARCACCGCSAAGTAQHDLLHALLLGCPSHGGTSTGLLCLLLAAFSSCFVLKLLSCA